MTFTRGGHVVGSMGIIAGTWFGYRFDEVKGAALGFALGAVVSGLMTVLAFPRYLNEKEMVKRDMTGRQYVSAVAGLYLLAAIVFVILTPSALRGGHAGYADPFTPWALGFGALLAFVRLRQARNPASTFASPPTGEKVVGSFLGFLWFLSVFAVLLWYSDPIAAAVSKIGRGAYREAVADLSAVITEDAQNAMAYRNRGYARCCIGDTGGAIEDFSRVVQLQPGEASGYVMRGVASELAGQSGDPDFKHARELSPTANSLIESARRELSQERENKPQK